MKNTTRTPGVTAHLLDFRVMVLAVAAALALAVNGSEARQRGVQRPGCTACASNDQCAAQPRR